MAQHSRKDCGHSRISIWNICFAMFFPFLNGGGPFKNHPINCIPKAEWARHPLMRLDFKAIISYEIINLYNPSKQCFFQKSRNMQHNDDIGNYMFLAAFYVGWTKCIKPHIYGVFWNMEFRFLTCCELDFWAGGILCAALIFTSPVNSHRFSLRTAHY